MTRNLGIIDRVLRISIGLLLLIATSAHLLGLWGLIGVVPLVTGLFSFCPMYLFFGIKTCKLDEHSDNNASGV